MRVVVVGCGRVGAGLAAGLAAAGEVVAVVDKDPKAFERLGEEFTGQTVEGIGYDRDVLERAGVAGADALVAVTGGDNSNVRDHLEHRTLREEHAFGRGEVSLVRLELPQHLVDRSVADVEAEGLRVVSVTRRGGAFVPGPGTPLAEGEPSVLDRLGLDTVDTVVAATGDDEDNLVVSLLVKRWYAVPRVVARVNNPKNTWMFTDEWGVDTAVSAPAVMTWLLERAVGVQDVVALLRAERGRGVALVELTLDQDAPVLGRRPDEVDLPAGSVVVAVVRGDQVLAGADAGPFEPADEVLALTTLQAEPDLRRLLGGQLGGSHIPAG